MSSCGEGLFTCSSGECLPLRRRCDGRQDCRDASDEVCGCKDYCTGPAEHRCVDNTCVTARGGGGADPRCDGARDCPDGSDEFSCPAAACAAEEWRCVAAGLCIPASARCDGSLQCPDLSDEVGCCEAGDRFRCASGQCVAGWARCDGHTHCGDGSDEAECKRVMGNMSSGRLSSQWRDVQDVGGVSPC